MAWDKNDENRRAFHCNARLLRSLRESRKWSQKQLSQRSGYSVRLISKAEAGERIAFPTIEVLAKTLSSPELPVSASDLFCDPESMAKSFVLAQCKEQRNMADAVRDFVDPGCVFSIVGDPIKIPFAGDYVGLEAFEISVNRFFDLLEFQQGIDHLAGYQVVTSQTRVVLWGETWISPAGRPANKPIPVTKMFCFRKGYLCYYEERSDTQALENCLAPKAHDCSFVSAKVDQPRS